MRSDEQSDLLLPSPMAGFWISISRRRTGMRAIDVSMDYRLDTRIEEHPHQPYNPAMRALPTSNLEGPV